MNERLGEDLFSPAQKTIYEIYLHLLTFQTPIKFSFFLNYNLYTIFENYNFYYDNQPNHF